MGCVSSHPILPPSPMPHTTSGPPPRPILTARAHTFYDIPHEQDGAPPLLLAKAPPGSGKLDRRKAATWDIAPHSKLVNRERSPPAGMVQRSSGTLMVGGGAGAGAGGGRGKKGRGKGGYVGLEGEKREKERKGGEGQWHNRMQVGKEGEVWFF